MDPQIAAALLRSLAERAGEAGEAGVALSDLERRALRLAVDHLAKAASVLPHEDDDPTVFAMPDALDRTLREPPAVADGTGQTLHLMPAGPVDASARLGIDIFASEPQAVLRVGERVEPLLPLSPLARGLELEAQIEAVEAQLPDSLQFATRRYVMPDADSARIKAELDGRVRAVGQRLSRPCEAINRSLAVVAGRFRSDERRLRLGLVLHEGPSGRSCAPVVLRAGRGRIAAYRVRFDSEVDLLARLDELRPALERLAPPPFEVVASGWAAEQAQAWVERHRGLLTAGPALRELEGLDARWAAAVGATSSAILEDRGWVRA